LVDTKSGTLEKKYPLEQIFMQGGNGGEGASMGGHGGVAAYWSVRVINEIDRPVSGVAVKGGNGGGVFPIPVPQLLVIGGEGGGFMAAGNNGWDGGISEEGTMLTHGADGGEVIGRAEMAGMFYQIYWLYQPNYIHMKNHQNTVKVAVVQDSPVFLDREKTIEKACGLMEEAAKEKAQLIVFPEAFVSGYPDWVWLVPNSKRGVLDPLYAQLLENALTIPDKSTETLCKAAKKLKIHVAIGVHERNAEASNYSLYNTLLFIDRTGNIMGKHRKLIPTGGERLVWAHGDGSTLHVYDTEMGKIGGLICWENLMPLARNALYNQGIQIHLAPTWDSSEAWLLGLRHMAREGGMYVIGCCAAMLKEDIPDRFEFKEGYPKEKEWVNIGNSCIINPKGEYVCGPVSKKKEILFGEIDFSLIAASKRMFDVSGHYARPDVFQFSVRQQERTLKEL
jgi:nitrilase